MCVGYTPDSFPNHFKMSYSVDDGSMCFLKFDSDASALSVKFQLKQGSTVLGESMISDVRIFFQNFCSKLGFGLKTGGVWS